MLAQGGQAARKVLALWESGHFCDQTALYVVAWLLYPAAVKGKDAEFAARIVGCHPELFQK